MKEIRKKKKDIYIYFLVGFFFFFLFFLLRLCRGRVVVLAVELVVVSGEDSLADGGLDFGAVSRDFDFAVAIERVTEVLGVKEGQFLDADPLDFERSTRHEFARDRGR